MTLALNLKGAPLIRLGRSCWERVRYRRRNVTFRIIETLRQHLPQSHWDEMELFNAAGVGVFYQILDGFEHAGLVTQGVVYHPDVGPPPTGRFFPPLRYYREVTRHPPRRSFELTAKGSALIVWSDLLRPEEIWSLIGRAEELDLEAMTNAILNLLVRRGSQRERIERLNAERMRLAGLG